MTKILHVISSPMGEGSNSIKLGKKIVEKLSIQHEGSTIIENNVAEQSYDHLGAVQSTAFLTPPDQRTEEQLKAIAPSDEAVQQLVDADIVVIGVPLYNFMMPSALKAWIDHVVRSGITFRYTENGPEGLLKGKKLYLAISSGGIYSDGPAKSLDFAEPYLRTIMNTMGITDITTYRIEGLAVPGIKETALQKGLESVTV